MAIFVSQVSFRHRGMCTAQVGQPSVLFLDEPTSGLDVLLMGGVLRIRVSYSRFEKVYRVYGAGFYRVYRVYRVHRVYRVFMVYGVSIQGL